MIKHTLFLKWWFFAVLISVGAASLIGSGGISVLWEKDFTRLSFLLLSIFFIMSGWCGYKTWTLSRFIDEGKAKEDRHIVERIEHLIEVGWFTSDMCLTIGMVGTVIGFIVMLSGFTTIDLENVKTIQGLIKSLGSGMSTSLLTTLTGLVCSILLKIQYFNLSQAISKVWK